MSISRFYPALSKSIIDQMSGCGLCSSWSALGSSLGRILFARSFENCLQFKSKIVYMSHWDWLVGEWPLALAQDQLTGSAWTYLVGVFACGEHGSRSALLPTIFGISTPSWSLGSMLLDKILKVLEYLIANILFSSACASVRLRSTRLVWNSAAPTTRTAVSSQTSWRWSPTQKPKIGHLPKLSWRRLLTVASIRSSASAYSATFWVIHTSVCSPNFCHTMPYRLLSHGPGARSTSRRTMCRCWEPRACCFPGWVNKSHRPHIATPKK